MSEQSMNKIRCHVNSAVLSIKKSVRYIFRNFFSTILLSTRQEDQFKRTEFDAIFYFLKSLFGYQAVLAVFDSSGLKNKIETSFFS